MIQFEKIMVKVIQFLSSLFISIFLLFLSLWNSVTVNSQAELKHVGLGLPFSFIEQDLSRLSSNVPIELGIHSPLEYPIEVMWPIIILDVMLVTLFVFFSPVLFKKLMAFASEILNTTTDSQNSQENVSIQDSSAKDCKEDNDKVRMTSN